MVMELVLNGGQPRAPPRLSTNGDNRQEPGSRPIRHIRNQSAKEAVLRGGHSPGATGAAAASLQERAPRWTHSAPPGRACPWCQVEAAASTVRQASSTSAEGTARKARGAAGRSFPKIGSWQTACGRHTMQCCGTSMRVRLGGVGGGTA